MQGSTSHTKWTWRPGTRHMPLERGTWGIIVWWANLYSNWMAKEQLHGAHAHWMGLATVPHIVGFRHIWSVKAISYNFGTPSLIRSGIKLFNWLAKLGWGLSGHRLRSLSIRELICVSDGVTFQLLHCLCCHQLYRYRNEILEFCELIQLWNIEPRLEIFFLIYNIFFY